MRFISIITINNIFVYLFYLFICSFFTGNMHIINNIFFITNYYTLFRNTAMPHLVTYLINQIN